MKETSCLLNGVRVISIQASAYYSNLTCTRDALKPEYSRRAISLIEPCVEAVVGVQPISGFWVYLRFETFQIFVIQSRVQGTHDCFKVLTHLELVLNLVCF